MRAFQAAESGGAGGLQVVLPPWYEVFWAAVILLILLLVIGKYALPRIYAVLDQRAQKIREGLSAADAAQEHAAAAERERERLLREAQEEAQRVRADAHADAQRIVARARAQAGTEATRITEAARGQIEAERRSAQSALRSEVGILAVDLAEKIVGEHLRDDETSARVVDRYLDELEDAR